jgi:AbrB family looped-hinge helix DNA binding protein
MTTLTVSNKGWVVIPAEYRRRYGLKPGSKLMLVDYGGILALVPAHKDPIREGAGLLAGGPSLTEALLEERAREREREG